MQFGPVFTLKVAGERLTFVTELEDFDHFFLSPSVDFQGAVQSAVSKTGKQFRTFFAALVENIFIVINSVCHLVRWSFLDMLPAVPIQCRQEQICRLIKRNCGQL